MNYRSLLVMLVLFFGPLQNSYGQCVLNLHRDARISDFIEIFECLNTEISQLKQELRDVSELASKGPSGGIAVPEGSVILSAKGSWALKHDQDEVRLGIYPICAITRSGETCSCAVEKSREGVWWLRKYDEHFLECICEAMCLELSPK